MVTRLRIETASDFFNEICTNPPRLYENNHRMSYEYDVAAVY